MISNIIHVPVRAKRFYIEAFFVSSKHKEMAKAKSLHTPIELYIIERVKEKRIEKGYSQMDLAYELDLSSGFVGDVENPRRRAKYNLNHINALAKIFQCSPRDFMPGKAL